jgi:subtilisin family serine protease
MENNKIILWMVCLIAIVNNANALETCSLEEDCYDGSWTDISGRVCSGTCYTRQEMQRDITLVNEDSSIGVIVEKMPDNSVIVFYEFVSEQIGRLPVQAIDEGNGKYSVMILGVVYEFEVDFEFVELSESEQGTLDEENGTLISKENETEDTTQQTEQEIDSIKDSPEEQEPAPVQRTTPIKEDKEEESKPAQEKEEEPIKEKINKTIKYTGEIEDFSMLVNLGKSSPTGLFSMYFSDNLGIDLEKIASEMDNVVSVKNNSILIKNEDNNIQPFILSKKGNSTVKISYKGYIIKLEKEPLIEKRINIEEDIEKRIQEIKSINTEGFWRIVTIPYKAFKEMRLRSVENNFENNLEKHVRKIEAGQSKVSRKIQKLIEKERGNKVTGNVVYTGANIKSGFYKTFNGILVEDISDDEARNIRKIRGVEKVSPNFEVKVSLYDSVGLINADKLWDNGFTGDGVSIAIIDTGVDYTHADLGGCLGDGCKVIGGYDFINNDDNPMDDHGHGTHVAATAAGRGTLNGVAPDAKIYAYKVLSAGGSGNFNDIIASVERAVDPNNDGDLSDHVDIISMSLGGYCGSYSENCGPNDDISIAIDNAVKNGVVAVIAAGNDGPNKGTIGTPGTSREAITVGAACKPGQINNMGGYCPNEIARFSSRGPVEFKDGVLNKPDILAPGVMICAAQWDSAWENSKCLDDEHTAISGTSMATPHVAGAAALLKQAHPDWNPYDIKSALLFSSKDLGFESYEQGTGFMNVQDANDEKLFFYPYSFNLGRITDTLPEPVNLTIKNDGDSVIDLSLSVDNNNIFIEKQQISVEPGSVEGVLVSLKSILGDGYFTEFINISSQTHSYKLPFSYWMGSQIILDIKSGIEPSTSHIAITNENITYADTQFNVVTGKSFYVTKGNYVVYALGDAYSNDVEYILMDKIKVEQNSKVSVTLDINDARPFTIKAEALDGTKLLLYQWYKGYNVFTEDGCYLTNDLLDPIYGDRTVYISNKPEIDATVDIIFKYEGVPSDKERGPEDFSYSGRYNWRTNCDWYDKE